MVIVQYPMQFNGLEILATYVQNRFKQANVQLTQLEFHVLHYYYSLNMFHFLHHYYPLNITKSYIEFKNLFHRIKRERS